MDYFPEIEGFEGQNIEVKTSSWAGPKLLINGQLAEKGAKRGDMVLHRNDGRQVTATWKSQMLGLDAPQLVVDGKAVNLVEPLQWYQWVWSGWPILLVFIGGALGAIVGIIGFSISARLFRTNLNGFLKYIVTGLISIAAVLVYLVGATVIALLSNK